MSQQTLVKSLYQAGCIALGEFVLKSGQVSPIYLDLRRIISFPGLLKEVAMAMWEKVKCQPFDCICGVPYAALPLATIISLQSEIPLIMRRKEKKTYGTQQSIEGVYHRGNRCLIVEDVLTTGSSIKETIADLTAVGVTVTDVVIAIDRRDTKAALLPLGYQLHAVLTLNEIFNHLTADSSFLSSKEQQAIQQLRMDLAL